MQFSEDILRRVTTEVVAALRGEPEGIPIGVSAVLYLVTVYRGSVRQDLVRTYFPQWEKPSARIRGHACPRSAAPA